MMVVVFMLLCNGFIFVQLPKALQTFYVSYSRSNLVLNDFFDS